MIISCRLALILGLFTVSAVMLSGCLRTSIDRQSAPGAWTPPAKSHGSQRPSKAPDHTPGEAERIAVALAWPVRGDIISEFGESDGIGRRGIEIRTELGAHVGAAEYGKVAFVGPIRGFGRVVIVEHGRRLVTVYGGFGRVIVQKGMMVRRGQILGSLSKSSHHNGSSLRFQVRLRSKPVDPLRFLERIS